jgi:hypothetical protein
MTTRRGPLVPERDLAVLNRTPESTRAEIKKIEARLKGCDALHQAIQEIARTIHSKDLRAAQVALDSLERRQPINHTHRTLFR